MIDIDGQNFDAMLARIAHKLRGRVKAHGLRIEDRRAEDIRIMALDPGRDIDEQCKARRMTFGKPVISETFDLLEAPLGKIQFIVIADHPADELVTINANRP